MYRLRELNLILTIKVSIKVKEYKSSNYIS